MLEETHKYYHGEKVAFGTLCQLVLENASDEEINTVIGFCLEDIGVHDIGDRIKEVAAKACIPDESIHFMPFPVNEDMVAAAILGADKLGREAKGCCCCD